MGNIGKVVAQKWIGAFECSVLGFDPKAPKGAWSDVSHERVGSLEEVLERSDVVTLHVPLLDSTRRILREVIAAYEEERNFDKLCEGWNYG